MKRKTNLFYNAGKDSNFVTFSNYTEALTGNVLATDAKLFPSKFICMYVPALDKNNEITQNIKKTEIVENLGFMKIQNNPNENGYGYPEVNVKDDTMSYDELKSLFIRQYLSGYYENKLANIRDWNLNNNTNVETSINPLKYLLDTIYAFNRCMFLNNPYAINDVATAEEENGENSAIADDEISQPLITFVGDICEQDFNGTFMDNICIIENNATFDSYIYSKGALKLTQGSQTEESLYILSKMANGKTEMDRNVSLYGWENASKMPDGYDEIFPIFDSIAFSQLDSTDEDIVNKKECYGIYYPEIDTNRLSECIVKQEDDTKSIKFNILIPLFDIYTYDFDGNNEIDHNDGKEDGKHSIFLSDNELVLSSANSHNQYDIPLGIWFSDEVIELKRHEDINGSYRPSWSLCISSQFKPFPYGMSYPTEIDEESNPDKFASFAMIMAKQASIMNEISVIKDKLSSGNFGNVIYSGSVSEQNTSIATNSEIKKLMSAIEEFKNEYNDYNTLIEDHQALLTEIDFHSYRFAYNYNKLFMPAYNYFYEAYSYVLKNGIADAISNFNLIKDNYSYFNQSYGSFETNYNTFLGQYDDFENDYEDFIPKYDEFENSYTSYYLPSYGYFGDSYGYFLTAYNSNDGSFIPAYNRFCEDYAVFDNFNVSYWTFWDSYSYFEGTYVPFTISYGNFSESYHTYYVPTYGQFVQDYGYFLESYSTYYLPSYGYFGDSYTYFLAAYNSNDGSFIPAYNRFCQDYAVFDNFNVSYWTFWDSYSYFEGTYVPFTISYGNFSESYHTYYVPSYGYFVPKYGDFNNKYPVFYNSYEYFKEAYYDTFVPSYSYFAQEYPTFDEFVTSYWSFFDHYAEFDTKYLLFDEFATSYWSFFDLYDDFINKKETFDTDANIFNGNYSEFSRNYTTFNRNYTTFSNNYNTFSNKYNTFDNEYTVFFDSNNSFNSSYDYFVANYWPKLNEYEHSQDAIDLVDTKLNELYREFNTTKDSLTQGIADNTDSINAINSSLETLDDSINDPENGIVARANAIESSQETNANAISSINAEIEALNSRIAALESKLENYESLVTRVQRLERLLL